MSIKARKFEVTCSSFVPPDADEIRQELSASYDTKYVGVYIRNGSVCIYLYFENRVVQRKILSNIRDQGIEADSIAVCTQFRGEEIVTESGNKKRHRGPQKKTKRKSPVSPSTINNITNNNTTINDNSTKINIIIINPIGMECLDHITPEFIQKLLAEHHGPEVVFEFGTKMYSLKENMNFKTDVKSGYVSGLEGDDRAWVTHRKNKGFSMLLENLKDKNEEAVQKYVDTIPDEDIDNFEREMLAVREISDRQDDEPVYGRFIRDGFNVLAANIADKKRRIERDTGKKLELV